MPRTPRPARRRTPLTLHPAASGLAPWLVALSLAGPLAGPATGAPGDPASGGLARLDAEHISQSIRELARAESALLGLARGGPQAPDGRPLFPTDLRVVARHPAQRVLVVQGAFDADPDHDHLRLETWVGALAAAEVEGGATLWVRQADGTEVPLGGVERRDLEALRAPALGAAAPDGGGDAAGTPAPPPHLRPGLNPHRPQGRGALAGRRIALAAGHGWLQNANGTWATQRSRWAFEGCGSCRGITEDFLTAELVSRHLIPMLENMGAEVVLVREPDHDLRPAAVLDDGEPGYAEAGEGFAPGANPGGFADDYRTLAPEADGRAVYTPAVEGLRRLSVRWREGENRAPRARVQVDHAGGRTLIDLDQRRFGRHWLDLGQYVFDAERSSISLLHGDGAGVLIADALKVGGGIFAAADRPWWQMAAKTYVPWAGGAGAAIEGRGDVTIRPGYAEHVGADVYLSIHANASGVAGGSGANGLSTYRYSCQQYPDHSGASAAVNCDLPAGSARLAETVHAAILERLRSDYDPGYRNVGTRVANFGELRELSRIPGILIEAGFFDNVANPTGNARFPDNRSLHDPRWREAFAYGLASGVARHFGAEAPPARPQGVFARNRPDGTLELTWDAVPGANSYRIYTATTGRNWDDGVQVRDPRWASAGLTVGRVYAFRVAALSFDGEGLASQAVVARFRGARLAPGTPAAQALWIGGYDRRDAFVQTEENDLQTAVEHGHALATAPGLYFDGALDERVETEPGVLADYALLVHAAGKDSTEHDAISPPLRAAFATHHAAGGALLLSGEEIGWDLVARSDDPAEAGFLRGVLGAEFEADDAEAQTMTGVGPLAAAGAVAFDDGTGDTYAVRFPDVFAVAAEAEGGAPGAEVAMVYPDGTAAAVATPQSLLFGVPLETVVPVEARAAVYAAGVAHLLGALPAAFDLDGDGADDRCERRHGFNERDSADGAEDTDGDGRNLAAECAEGTDPRRPDPLEPDAGLDAEVVADAGRADADPVDADPVDADPVDAAPDQADPDARADLSSPDGGPPDDALVDAARPDARLDAAAFPDGQVFPDFALDRGVARPDGGSAPPRSADEGGCTALPHPGGAHPGGPALLFGLALLGLGRRRAGSRARSAGAAPGRLRG